MASAQAVSAQNSGQNDSVDYAPGVHTVAGTLPLDTQTRSRCRPPRKLNKKGEEALPNGIPAELRVNVASYPVGFHPGGGACAGVGRPLPRWFSTSSARSYNNGEGWRPAPTPRLVTTCTPSRPLDRRDWAGATPAPTLTVTVSEPVVLDTTPPDVTITSPTAGQKFTFCTGRYDHSGDDLRC